MSMHRIAVVALLALAVLVACAVAEEAVKSGPQTGQVVPGPFHPLNVTGESAGKKACLFYKNGDHPVAMIFARDTSAPVVKLIKRIDEATAKNSGCKMGSFVVFLSDDEGLEKQLKELADKEKIEHTVLSIDNPAGPQRYNVAQDAAVTVVLYTDHKVKANFAFKKGQLQDKNIDTIVGDIKKILPAE
jgi:hypothetical protein